MKVGILKRPAVAYPGAFLLALGLGLLVSFALERALGRGEVLRGVVVNGHALAGLDERGVMDVLSKRRAQVESAKLSFRLQEDTLPLLGRDVGLTIDLKTEAAAALTAGRTGNWMSQFGFWIARLFGNAERQSSLVMDTTLLSAKLKPWAEGLLPPPEAPEITYDTSLKVKPGRGGTAVQVTALAATLTAPEFSQRILGTQPIEVAVPTKTLPPPVPLEVVEKRQSEAAALVAGSIEIVTAEGARVASLSAADLGSALLATANSETGEFLLELSSERLREVLADALAELERPAVNAGFEFKAGAAPTITPSEVGARLDEAAFMKALFVASQAKPRRAAFSLKEVLPKLNAAQAQELAVKELVMAFSTHHACCQPRVKNIHHAASQLDGTVLKPGEVFSLNKLLGPRTRAAGYFEAPAIVHGEMEDVFGGGISQLATTLFYAVLKGGYEVIQRQPHSVYFSRYPEGHEATVSFPLPDLIFRNDTKAGMVIKADAAPTFIKISIYGDTAGRRTSVKKSQRYKVEKPPKEYEPDEEMDPEKPKRLRAGQLGWTVLVSRTVTEADGTEKTERREVVYNPRPELLRVHPCIIPKGEPGHTGEDCPEPEIEEREEELSDEEYFETR